MLVKYETYWAYEKENSLHTSHVEQTERQTDGRTDSQTHPYFDHFQNFILFTLHMRKRYDKKFK